MYRFSVFSLSISAERERRAKWKRVKIFLSH